jgi:Flp pilus assembly protein TadG
MGRSARPSGPSDHRTSLQESGQSVVELALVLPVLAFLLLAVADFARLYTTMISVESAAREAADYGALYPWRWKGDPDDPSSNHAKTVDEMQAIACKAVRNLPDYTGPDDACTNPAVSITIDPTPASEAATAADCWDVPRSSVPCNVTITLDYDFDIITPVNIAFGDTTLGLPSTLSFQRDSTFAISDFQIDEPLEAAP